MKRCTALLLIALALLLAPPCPAWAAALPQDGRYTVEVTLAGGSGRASVDSPAELTVESGNATALVAWSSPHYEFMLVGGVRYDPVDSGGGTAAFVIPVTLDADMAVSAQTIAMSEPHLIDYTLHFDAATLKPLQEGGGSAWVVSLAAVLLLCVAAAGLHRLRARQRAGGAGS